MATSNAFPRGVRMPLEPANDRPLGKTGIGASTTPSLYPVKVRCSGGSTITGTIEVVSPGQGGSEPATAPQEGWGAMIAAGGTLVVVAGIGVAVWRARRRRTEPHV
ncbi:hypothetical protein [Actinomadura sp. 6N118]|uniref:hypothetical protein n=1 Tax=Actinomadura sp. 6N118 TaxID=3375151 RepID=UPI00378FAFF4